MRGMMIRQTKHVIHFNTSNRAYWNIKFCLWGREQERVKQMFYFIPLIVIKICGSLTDSPHIPFRRKSLADFSAGVDGALNVVNCVIYDQQESRVNQQPLWYSSFPLDLHLRLGLLCLFFNSTENTPNHSFAGVVPLPSPPCLASSAAVIIVPHRLKCG